MSEAEYGLGYAVTGGVIEGIDELQAFAQFLRDEREREVVYALSPELRPDTTNDKLLAIAKIIDPAAFLPSRRDDDNMSASDALGKARRIMELG